MEEPAAGTGEGARRPPRGGRGLKWLSSPLTLASLCRPPRGGRGLKSTSRVVRMQSLLVVPLAGDVD